MTFAVQDNNNQSAPAEGTVFLKIDDDRGTVLYEGIKHVKVNDYTKSTNGNWVYSWGFPSSEVKPGVPNLDGWVYGRILFLSAEGITFTAHPTVVIPELGIINITTLHFADNYNGTEYYYKTTWPTQKIYIGDTFTFMIVTNTGLEAQYVPDINNVWSNTSGFSIVSTDPVFPIPSHYPYDNPIWVTIQTPDQAYSGELSLFINGTLNGIVIG